MGVRRNCDDSGREAFLGVVGVGARERMAEPREAP